MSFVRNHPVITFFILAYALAWAGVPFGSFYAPGALVAALIVVFLTEGLAGLRALGARVIRWRVRWVWYVVAIAVPLLVHVVTMSLNQALGAPAPNMGQFTPWYGLALVDRHEHGRPDRRPVQRGAKLPRLRAGQAPGAPYAARADRDPGGRDHRLAHAAVLHLLVRAAALRGA